MNGLSPGMSELQIHNASKPTAAPHVKTSDPAVIRQMLAIRGISFQRWAADKPLAEGADQESILQAYAQELARVQASGHYRTVDAIRITPDHPDRDSLRRTFLSEHSHADDEVRFFVEGRGLFCLHIGDEVVQVLCEANDWISIPAGIKHWFDMGSEPNFCDIRFFDNAEGWVAQFTGDVIAERFPLLE